jgi:hypothetical protein
VLLIQLSCFISSALRRIEDFNFYRPRRTRNALFKGSHSSKHENDRVAFRRIDIRRSAPLTAEETH